MVLRYMPNIVPLLDLSDTISDLIPKKDVLYRPVRDQDERYLGNSPLMGIPTQNIYQRLDNPLVAPLFGMSKRLARILSLSESQASGQAFCFVRTF